MARRRTVSLYRKGKMWYVSFWRDGKRERESTGTDNRKVAEEVRRQRERETILGTVDLEDRVSLALQDPRRCKAILDALEVEKVVDVETARKEYKAHSETFKRPKTVSSDEGRLDGFFQSVGVQCVSDVMTKHINDYFAAKVKDDGTSPTTLLRIREVLHAFYEFVRKQGYVKSNPVNDVPRPRIPEHDIRYLSLDQIGKALEVVEGSFLESVVATAIYAGLRREELCWLTWEDLALEGERPIMRVRSKTVDGESWVPKTKRNRTVPISRDLLTYLQRQQLSGRRSGWVFPSPEGCRWDPDNLSHRLREAMKGAKLIWGFLDFRHTFGSQLAQKGVSLYKISQLMGNSPEIARRHYARLAPEEMHEEVEFSTRHASVGV